MSTLADPATKIAFSIHENKGVFALLLGSGLSRSAEIPTGWEITSDLVRRIAVAQGVEEQSDWHKWYHETYKQEPDYSQILGEIASTPDERRSILHGYIEPSASDREEGRKTPTAAHKAIAQLVRDGFIRVIITTNFDRLLENALREVGVEPTIVSSSDALRGAEPLAHTGCYILKIHGDYKDARILNTEEELSAYPAEYNAVLDRILDDYGLIVCGWSGEWDHALRSAILRAPNRRYPLFWASRGELGPNGRELCNSRKGMEIKIESADAFFTTLADQITTIRETQRQNPAETALLLERAKRYMSRTEYRIKFSDLVDQEVWKVIDRSNDEDFSCQGAVSSETVMQRIRLHESAGEGLVKISGLTGVWGDEEQIRTIANAIKTLWAALQADRNGMVVLLNLRGYIPALMSHACILGLIKNSRWKELRSFWKNELPCDRHHTETFLDDLSPLGWRGSDKAIWSLLPGLENRHTPFSDHIYELFDSSHRTFLGSLPDFATLHLLSEVLPAIFALEHYSVKELEEELAKPQGFGQSYIRLPVWGRMGWSRWPTDRVLTQIESVAFSTELAEAGFIGGSPDGVRFAAQNVRRAIGRLHWY
ncbi:SIR2 family protein [Cereibacter changlensis]|uniref:SIR2-like protein n=1 Tax=Cereibacter changlensis TaxID=402884 RepID=A0A2W7R3F1_9RHOB|nr:SIR2 family protein [Cereibacter changlensis]PZX50427.1 SIR2-like protein [Cereibacter changlensis]